MIPDAQPSRRIRQTGAWTRLRLLLLPSPPLRAHRWPPAALLLLVLLAPGAWLLLHPFTAQPTLLHSDPALPSTPPPIDGALLARAQSVCDVDRHECWRALTWQELGAILAADVPQYLSRLPADQRAYMDARRRMAAEYRSVSDHIRAHKFGATCVLNAEGKKECEFEFTAAAPAVERDLLPPSRLFPNDFSYALEAGISHDLVWLQQTLPRNDSRIPRLVELYKPAAQFETMHLVNPPRLQTIPDIFHIHIFARTRTDTMTDAPPEENAATETEVNIRHIMADDADGDPFFSFSDDLLLECQSESRISASSHASSARKAAPPSYVRPPQHSKSDDAYWLARADRKAHRTGADGQPRVRDRKRNPRLKKGRRGGVFMSWLLDTFKLKEKQQAAMQMTAAAAAESSLMPTASAPIPTDAAGTPIFPPLPPFHIVDVAGGRGQIAFYLAAFHSLHVSVVDPAHMQVQRYADRYHEQRVAKRRARVQHMQLLKEGSVDAQDESQLQAAFAAAASLPAQSVDTSAPLTDASGVRMPVPWLPQLRHFKTIMPDSIALSLHKQYARPSPSPSNPDESSDDEEIEIEAPYSGDSAAATSPCGCRPPSPLSASGTPSAAPSAAAAALLSSALDAALASCSLLYGMHADGATEAMVDFALQHNLPVAVVPCCVFPDAAPHRRVRRRRTNDGAAGASSESGSSSSAAAAAADDEWVPVRSYDQFLDYLQAKHPSIQRVNLPFDGRNTCIFRTID